MSDSALCTTAMQHTTRASKQPSRMKAPVGMLAWGGSVMTTRSSGLADTLDDSPQMGQAGQDVLFEHGGHAGQVWGDDEACLATAGSRAASLRASAMASSRVSCFTRIWGVCEKAIGHS